MFQNFANLVSAPSSYITREARSTGLSLMVSSYGLCCREALSLNALFYLDCIRARVIKLTLPGRPHAMSGVMWPLLTVEAHVGVGVGGRRLEYGTERKSDVINWDMCLCVCVCETDCAKREPRSTNLPFIVPFLPVSWHKRDPIHCYSAITLTSEKKKEKKKKVRWSLTGCKIGWMNMGDALKRDTSLQCILQEGGGWGLGGRDPFMWQQSGCSNNDVVLALWTGMLAGFLRVYPSAARQWHSMTDIKLSLLQCNNGIRL